MGPCQFFSMIDLPEDLSPDGVRQAIKLNRKRIYFGDMSWDEYQLAVFTKAMDEWPLGHLQDHRVSMPAEHSATLLAGGENAIAAALERFLCALDQRDAVEMIGNALELSPRSDAMLLLEIGRACPAMFDALLGGRLDVAKRLVPGSSVRRPQAQRAMSLMLIYYGALELQLIAARSRAIGRFGFGVTGPEAGPATGNLLTGWEGVTRAILYAERSAAGNRPEGPTPRLIRLLHWKARNIQRRLGLPEDKVLEAISPLLTDLMAPIIQSIVLPAHQAWIRTKLEIDLDFMATGDVTPKKNKPHGRQPEGARLTLPALLDGQTAGQQIAFASLRLESLLHHASALVAKKRVTAFDFEVFNQEPFREGADGPSLRLYFVHQAIVMQNHNTRPGRRSIFDTFGGYADKKGFGNKSVTTIKEARKQQLQILQDRQVVRASRNVELVGAQRYDILPDFRLGVKPTLPSKSADRADGKKGHDQSNPIRRHEIVKKHDFLWRAPPPRAG